MIVQFHNGEIYKYLDIDRNKIEILANKMGIPITEGENIFGAWSPEDKKSLGAAFYQQILKDPKYAKARKGEPSNPYWRKLETPYDYWEKLRTTIFEEDFYIRDYPKNKPRLRLTFPLYLICILFFHLFAAIKWMFTGSYIFNEKSFSVKQMIAWDRYCRFNII